MHLFIKSLFVLIFLISTTVKMTFEILGFDPQVALVISVSNWMAPKLPGFAWNVFYVYLH